MLINSCKDVLVYSIEISYTIWHCVTDLKNIKKHELVCLINASAVFGQMQQSSDVSDFNTVVVQKRPGTVNVQVSTK